MRACFGREVLRSDTIKAKAATFVICVIASFAIPASALANDTMDTLIAGATLRITTASGAVVDITFTSDGEYQATSGSSGTWTMEGDELCTRRSADNILSCGQLPSGKQVGDSWETTSGTGQPVTASIV